MENFKFKTQRSQIFQSYSNFKKKLSQTIQTHKQNQFKYHPQSKQNGVHIIKQNILQQKKYPHLLYPHLLKPKHMRHKYSQSSHQTTHQQNNKRCFTYRANTFKKNKMLTDHNKNDDIDDSYKNLKKIQILMNEKKKKFETNLRQSYSKLNASYKNSFQDTIKYEILNKKQLRLSESQSMDIKMETKSRKKIVFKGDSKYSSNINKQKNQHEELFIKQNNLFSIVIHPKKCMDGIFPMFRSGASLSSYSSSIYLFGGVNSKLADCYHFNEYLTNEKQWVNIKTKQNYLNIVPSYHTVQLYRNSLIFIGGSSQHSNYSNKVFNPDILIYDTDKDQFSKIKWNINIKSHASTIYSNMLVVYGGIDQKNTYSNKLYFLPLNTSNISMTPPHPYNLGSNSQGIAFHKIVNTFQIDNHLKNRLQIDGILCFGGKFANGTLNQDLMLFRFNKNKQAAHTQRIIKGWQVAHTFGQVPTPRHSHSMNILYKKCICIVIGGVDINTKVLNDAWILDLTTSTWIQALFDIRHQVLERGIFSHATTVMNGEIYVFGGMNGENKIINQFWSMDFTFNRAAKKQQELKKSRSYIPSSSKLTKQQSRIKHI